MSKPLTKIAIVGANGTLGPHILHSLLSSSSPTFNITVLSRASSKSTYPCTVTVKSIPDSLEHSALVNALQGQHVLIIAVTGYLYDVTLKFISAASQAGVSRIVPPDFGSCDSSNEHTLTVLPLYKDKKAVRERLIDLASESDGKLSWTSIVCGHFLDYGLRGDMMQIDFEARRARRFGSGEIPFSCSVLRTVGEAVVGVLRQAEETRNRMVYIQTVRLTQNELLRVVEELVGGEKFEVEEWDTEEFINTRKEMLAKDPGDHVVKEDLVGVEGITNADWKEKKDFVNDLLGLPVEDVKAVVKECLDSRK